MASKRKAKPIRKASRKGGDKQRLRDMAEPRQNNPSEQKARYMVGEGGMTLGDKTHDPGAVVELSAQDVNHQRARGVRLHEHGDT